MQASFVVEEWVDHALSKSREAKGQLTQSEKALADAEKKLKGTFFHLAEVEKGGKNAEATQAGFEKQVEELRVSLKKSETQLALAMEKTKQQQKQLEDKDVGMTKTTQSLTAQLQDVAWAFYAEV